jgi:Fe-S oxidoreductase
MFEAKAAYVRDNGMPLGQSLLIRIDRLAAAASRLPLVANWALRSRVMRWLAEKTLGISANRRLPKFARRSFLHETARRSRRSPALPEGDTKRAPVDRVAFLVDTYVNYFDVQLAEALIAVLKHNGVSVVVPPDQTSAGMPLVAHGILDAARDVARQNVAGFAELARDGYTIVTTEPSAALAVSHEYPVILPDDEDALVVASATQEACQFLWKLHLRGKLQLDLRRLDISLGYHTPCHLMALGIGTPSENLLRLIPGVSVERWEKGCSGMAGLFGLASRNYHNSIRAGMPLIKAVRESNTHLAATECCTCKMQIEHATSTPTVHPIKLIGWAYGLIPESAIERSLVRPVGRRKGGRR